MRKLLLLVLLLTLTAAPAAHAGKSIKQRPDCTDQYVQYSKRTAERYRYAVLCLMSFARTQFKLNALKQSAQLEKAGQKWASHLAKTGETTHGPSVALIPKRILEAGYRAQAVNEGLGIGDPSYTPYDIVDSMMHDFACTEILDPRFRDAGVGLKRGKSKLVGGPGIHVVVEFGLKATAKVPSTNGKPAKSCSHGFPARPSSPVMPVPVAPAIDGDQITGQLRCVTNKACAFEASLKLVHQGAVSRAGVDALAPSSTTEVVFTFPAGAIAEEQAGNNAGVELKIASTKPYAFDDVFSVGI